MCARTLLLTKRVELKLFVLPVSPEIQDTLLKESTLQSPNLAPTDPICVLRMRQGSPELASLRWGLVPESLRQSPARHLGAPLINARRDKLARWPEWRRAMRSRRALVIVSGWIEWREQPPVLPQRQGSLFGGSQPIAQPWLFSAPGGGPMALAGIWNPWDPSGAPGQDSVAIITAPASPALSPWHDRSPCVLAPDHWAAWLNHQTPSPESLLSSPSVDLQACALDPRINAPGDKSPEVLRRVGVPERLGPKPGEG